MHGNISSADHALVDEIPGKIKKFELVISPHKGQRHDIDHNVWISLMDCADMVKSSDSFYSLAK